MIEVERRCGSLRQACAGSEPGFQRAVLRHNDINGDSYVWSLFS
jgi:hypothetical protein